MEPTISGDRLIAAFRFLENMDVEMIWEKGEPGPIRTLALAIRAIPHPLGATHWIRKIALRSPTYHNLTARMDARARARAHFVIPAIVEKAIRTASGPSLPRGLSADEKMIIHDALSEWLKIVAKVPVN